MRQRVIGLVPVVALAAFLLSSGCAIINDMTGISEVRELHQSGLPAQATILKIWDSGMTINNDPVVWFELEVHPDGETPFLAKTKCPISRLDVPQFQPGRTVPVRYDAADHKRVALDVYEYK